ncbi:DUF6770 family protein [Psychroserpens algicola]|uniref:Uncharacterized protein n=1 Tax=Psychroserpens algicola TaxID=1719034 RepID=A0ABT0HA18_9FLAO|nr:DUF6770 family protein [Psychroserpens algicola]MCK8480849.1 hypothetical protein [Psychroserpens algicola]
MKKLLTTALLCAMCIGVYAQQKSLDEITSFKIKNSGTFIDKNKDVDGYYFYYEVDKLKKGKREYAIKMLDNNLNDIATKSYIDDKNTILAQSKFNNQALMFAMVNLKERMYKLVTFDKSGNQGEDIKIEVSKKELRWLSMMMKSGDFNLLFPVDDNGFLFNYVKNNKKLGYGLKYVSTNGGASWDFNSPEDAKELLFLNPLEANDKVVVAMEGSKKSMLSQTIDMKVVVIDIKTGKRLFEKDFSREDNPRLITNAFLTKDDNVVLLGEYFDKGDNIAKDDSKGLFAQVVDLTGNEISDNKVSWEHKIDKMMPADSDGKKRKSTYVYFHDIIRTQTGSYYCIGEKYRKTISAGGMLLGGNATQLTITDAVIFEFNNNFELQNIKQIEKGKSRAPSITDFGSPQLNAHALAAYGAFDYEFTQIDQDRDRFYSTFIDYERLKGEKNKLAFKAVMYSDGELTEDKIYLQESKGKVSFRVLPAKLGHVMILEYNRKEKTLDIHLEKLNL